MVCKSKILKLYDILCRIIVQVYWLLIYTISEAAHVLNGSYRGYASILNKEKCFQYYYFLQVLEERVSCA